MDQLRKDYGFKGRLAVVDAGKIAMEEMKVPITNTTMLGALIRAAGIIRLDSMDKPLAGRFGKIAERNKRSMQRAFDETQNQGVINVAKVDALHPWKEVPLGCAILEAGNARTIQNRRLALQDPTDDRLGKNALNAGCAGSFARIWPTAIGKTAILTGTAITVKAAVSAPGNVPKRPFR